MVEAQLGRLLCALLGSTPLEPQREAERTHEQRQRTLVRVRVRVRLGVGVGLRLGLGLGSGLVVEVQVTCLRASSCTGLLPCARPSSSPRQLSSAAAWLGLG